MTTLSRGEQTARIISHQLGGNSRLSAMIGATHFAFSDKDNSLQFHFKMCKKANIIKIKCNSLDLYDIEFYKYNRRSFACPMVKEFNNIYAEDMRGIIEEFTGLYLNL